MKCPHCEMSCHDVEAILGVVTGMVRPRLSLSQNESFHAPLIQIVIEETWNGWENCTQQLPHETEVRRMCERAQREESRLFQLSWRSE